MHRFQTQQRAVGQASCRAVAGVFDAAGAPADAPGVSFRAALAHTLDAAAFADVQARVRTRVLRTFVKRGLIDRDVAGEMRAWAHDGGFSVDGSVRIEGADRTFLERLSHLCDRHWLSNIRTNAMPDMWSIATPSRCAQRRPARVRQRWCPHHWN